MTWNWLSMFPAILGMMYFGRKTLTMIGQIGMSITLTAVWVCQMIQDDDIAILMCALFLTFFEIGIGSVFWVYISEVCSNQGVGVASATLYAMQLIVGFATPILMNTVFKTGEIFLLFAVSSFVGFLYLSMKMKETVGL